MRNVSLSTCRAGVATPPEVQAEIVRLYQAGVTRADIVKSCGCGKRAISIALQKYGVPLRGGAPGKLSDERIQEVRRLYEGGGTCSEIGKKLDMSRSAVAGVIHRYGFTRPDLLNQINVLRACVENGNKTGVVNLAKGRIAGIKRPRPMTNQPAPFKIGGKGHVYRMPPTVELPKFTGATPSSNPKPFLQRLSGECTWPVSGEGRDTYSCCAPVVGGTSWCEDHNRTGRMNWRGRGWESEPQRFVAEIIRRCA